jgi:hypothetical protein
VKKVPVVYTKDLLEYKDRHSLKLPQGWSAALVHDERHLVILGEMLERQGFMNGKKNMIGFPHRDLIVLPFPADDHDGMKRVKEIEIKRECTEPAMENTIVFSSLALLSTVLDCAALDWEINSSVDGTDGIACNDYVFIIYLAYDIAPRVYADGKKSFTRSGRPLFYIFGPGKRKEVALLGLLAFMKACWDLF